jgi:hypothetical protein
MESDGSSENNFGFKKYRSRLAKPVRLKIDEFWLVSVLKTLNIWTKFDKNNTLSIKKVKTNRHVPVGTDTGRTERQTEILPKCFSLGERLLKTEVLTGHV